MKTKTLISGLIFVVLLGLYAFDVFYKKKTDTPADSKAPVIVFDRSSIVRLRILGSIPSSIDISRSNTLPVESPLLHRANWVLKDPAFAPVDEVVFDDLLHRIERVSGSVFTDEVDEASLGLSPPELILIMDFEDGKKEVLSFGTKSPVTKRRFIQREGDSRMYVTSQDFPRYFTEIQDKIKSREVLKVNPGLVTTVDVIHEEEYFRLISQACQKGENHWTVSGKTGSLQGDAEFISRKIRELSNLKVKRIFETPVEIFSFTGLDNPFLVLNLSFQVDETGEFVCDKDKKKELLLQFGKGLGVQLSEAGTLASDVSYYLKIGGEVRLYEIEKGFFSDWLQGYYHFRERCPFCDLSEISTESITSISISDPDSSCSVVFGEGAESEIESVFSSLQGSLNEVIFDALLTESELQQYPSRTDISFEIGLSDDAVSFEVAGAIKETSDGESADLLPVILKVKRHNESPYYGVLRDDTLSPLRLVVKDICNRGAR
jgi:hypothetical protein